MKYHSQPIFRCDPIWGCYRLVSRAKVIENQTGISPEFYSTEDDVLPAEEQPLPAAVSPTADLPGYIPESDLEEDPEEDDDEDPEEDPADYPTDRDERRSPSQRRG
ncbi:hypothetical protein Tco_0718718 [Tanacetum coccineum]